MTPISLDTECRVAIAEDAESLASLHDRELTPRFFAALREARFPECLGLMPATVPTTAAWRAMRYTLSLQPATPNAHWFDNLAADYAAIYLTNAYGASPLESVWLDDDHLSCQDAMFELRAIYAAAGLATRNWRQRPDDHLVLQLLYVSHAARNADTPDDWRALAHMLDEHLLRWIDDFASRIVARSEASFYAALAVLTSAWLDTLRTLIAAHLKEARPTREEIEMRMKSPVEDKVVPLAFMPGLGPTL
ncbi:MAG: molecular chaperone TorD family protein [Betaproteobacteria bacterium]|nr:molecular chaperone TorD family protein [Betaproteobacteria bacterium]